MLVAEADAIGLDPAAFATTLTEQSGETLQRHIRETRLLMHRVGAGGFPAFMLENEFTAIA